MINFKMALTPKIIVIEIEYFTLNNPENRFKKTKSKYFNAENLFVVFSSQPFLSGMIALFVAGSKMNLPPLLSVAIHNRFYVPALLNAPIVGKILSPYAMKVVFFFSSHA